MKRGRKEKRRLMTVSVGTGAIAYIITLVLLFILAQTLPIPFTHTLVRLCLAMPFVSIFCLVISQFFLHAVLPTSGFIISRRSRIKVRAEIRNRSFLPISSAVVSLSIPNQKGEKGVVFASNPLQIPPFSSVCTECECELPRRGRFEVGTGEILIYDFLRIVGIRKKLGGIYTVSVCPRLSQKDGAELDAGSTEEDSAVTQDTFASYEYGDVRDYRIGDSMKRIHWKLSTKSDELQVRRNVALNESNTCIVCDRSGEAAYGISKTDRLEIDDRTVEEALSAVYDICACDGRGSIAVNTDDGGAICLPFGGVGDGFAVKSALSSLETGAGKELYALIPEGATAVYYILSFFSPFQAGAVFSAHRLYPTEFNVCIRDISAFVPTDKRPLYKASLDGFLRVLSENGISYFVAMEGGNESEK